MKYINTILLLLITEIVFSQRNLVDGFVVSIFHKDTIRGKINDQDWAINPLKISFINEANEEREYKIEELKSFGITNKENYIGEF